MLDESQIEDLLDVWDDLREAGESISIDEFIRRYCDGVNAVTLASLRQKIDAIESIDGFLAHATDLADADVETHIPGETDKYPVPQLQPGAEPVTGYRLISRLGQGGFGEVWKAEGAGGFHVALNFVRLDRDASESELRSLELLKRLRHPNLISTIGAWQQDGWLVIALELVGQSLQDRLDRLREQGQSGLPKAELLSYMRDAAKAIDYLNQPRHPLGDGRKGSIQHRDIKPRNLLLSGGGLKVADLGIARLLEGVVTGHTGAMSVAYAAPEFFEGKTSDRSDQYSLAVTYCQLRGGRLPFEGTDLQIMKGHVEGEPDLSMIPEEERPVVMRALTKNPQNRWRSCSEFVAAIEKSKAVSVKITAESADSPQTRDDGRVRIIAGIVTLGLTTLVIIGIGNHFLTGAKTTDAIDSTEPVRGVAASNRELQDASVVSNSDQHPVIEKVEQQPSAISEIDSSNDAASSESEKGTEKLPVSSTPQKIEPTNEAPSESTSASNTKLEKIRDFVGHSEAVRSVAFSPDGQLALSGGIDQILRLWDVASGTEVRYFSGRTSTVNRVAFAPNGKTAISAGYDQTVRVWNVESGKQLQVLKAYGDVRGLAINSDGSQIISGTRRKGGGSIQIWSIGSAKEITRFESLAHVWTVDISPDGKQVASGGFDGRIEVRNLTSGKLRHIGSHSSLVTTVKFMPDGESLMSSGSDGKLRQWDLGTGKILKEISGGVMSLTTNVEFCISASGNLQLWDLRTTTLVDQVDGISVSSLSIDPQGKLVLASVGNTIQLWKLPSVADR